MISQWDTFILPLNYHLLGDPKLLFVRHSSVLAAAVTVQSAHMTYYKMNAVSGKLEGLVQSPSSHVEKCRISISEFGKGFP